MSASDPATHVSGGTSARDRLLAAAAECFYAEGVHATGIDTLTAAAQVAKMSLYNNFASKDELVLAYLEARHEEWLGLYHQRLAEAEPSAAGGVGAVFDAYVDHASLAYRHGFRGCGLLNAAAELPAGSPGRDLVRRHKEQVEALLLGHVTQIESLSDEEASGAARQLSFILEGAVARAGLEGNADLLHDAGRLARQLVDGLLDPSGAGPTQ